VTTLAGTYDDTLSRVRLAATGLSGSAVTVRFEWSPDAIAWSVVRGGGALTPVGSAASADHYEFSPQAVNRYRVIELDSAGATLATTTISVGAPMNRVWLKVPAAPYANRVVDLSDWSDITRESRSATFAVQGRRDPVAVTELAGSRRVTVHLRATDDAEAAAVDTVLSLGLPVYLHVPPDCPLPSMHAVIGSFPRGRPTPISHVGKFAVPLVEVAAPDVTLAAPTVTYAALTRLYATYGVPAGDLASAHATYASILTLSGSAVDALAGT
jgi:hypothetical protein